MLTQLDLLSLVADQLEPPIRAQIVAGLAIEKMVSTLNENKHGAHSLNNPFTNQPFTVRTGWHDRNGSPFMCSTLLAGLGCDTTVLAVFQLGELNGEGGNAAIVPFIDMTTRQKLEKEGRDFDLLVFAAFVDFMDEKAAQPAAT